MRGDSPSRPSPAPSRCAGWRRTVPWTSPACRPGTRWRPPRLQRGDTLTALPLRDSDTGAITVNGWARVQGLFARKEGQRVGDFLKELNLLLPDTYLERGELVRTKADGTKSYFSFNLAKAMAGDPEHNLALEKRDTIELYRIGDLRLPQTLTVNGPVTRPGTFPFIKGMRASDLLFRAGVPQRSANVFVAELARTNDGQTSMVKSLDLTRLLSGPESSPIDLTDDNVNPVLEPYDQISVYAKPDFRSHRSITLSGQVARPGVYELESEKTRLRDVIARAGGLTPEAMPSAGIFLRSLGGTDPEKKRANAIAGVEQADPTSNGVNEILTRLSETKRLPQTGAILNSPLLHGLTAGTLNRMVVNMPGLLAGDAAAEVELADGDEVIIPRRTSVAYVVGETASPFASYKVSPGMKVKDMISLAGGMTPQCRQLARPAAEGRWPHPGFLGERPRDRTRGCRPGAPAHPPRFHLAGEPGRAHAAGDPDQRRAQVTIPPRGFPGPSRPAPPPLSGSARRWRWCCARAGTGPAPPCRPGPPPPPGPPRYRPCSRRPWRGCPAGAR